MTAPSELEGSTHRDRSERVAVTVPVRRGGILSLVAPIPPATISFHASAVVHPEDSMEIPDELAPLLPPDRRASSCIIEIIARGRVRDLRDRRLAHDRCATRPPPGAVCRWHTRSRVTGRLSPLPVRTSLVTLPARPPPAHEESMPTNGARTVIERATANDMMQLATDVGPVPMQVGARAGVGRRPQGSTRRRPEMLSTRIEGVPRLRQRLVRTAFGCGRPVWVDDETFSIDAHIHVRACPAPGDEAALLACATEILGGRLPLDRPPWAATIVTGLADGSSALIVVFNHVLADGIGGLAVLASLVDGMPPPTDYGFPRPAPSRRALAVDAAAARLTTRSLAGAKRSTPPVTPQPS